MPGAIRRFRMVIPSRLVMSAQKTSASTAAVVVLTPPAVPPGLPPMNIQISEISTVELCSPPSSTELNPAVRSVTD